MSTSNPIKQAWQSYAGMGLQPDVEDVRRSAARFDRHIRISVGRPEELDVVAAELPQALMDAS